MPCGPIALSDMSVCDAARHCAGKPGPPTRYAVPEPGTIHIEIGASTADVEAAARAGARLAAAEAESALDCAVSADDINTVSVAMLAVAQSTRAIRRVEMTENFIWECTRETMTRLQDHARRRRVVNRERSSALNWEREAQRAECRARGAGVATGQLAARFEEQLPWADTPERADATDTGGRYFR